MGRSPIHLWPWKPGDEAAFEARADLAADWARCGWDWGEGPPGPTWSLIRWPDQVIGVGGGAAIAEGVFQVWTILAPLRRGDWALALLCAATVIRHLERSHGARRLTVQVRQGFRQGERTLERLGFTRTTEDSRFPGYLIMAKGR